MRAYGRRVRRFCTWTTCGSSCFGWRSAALQAWLGGREDFRYSRSRRLRISLGPGPRRGFRDFQSVFLCTVTKPPTSLLRLQHRGQGRVDFRVHDRNFFGRISQLRHRPNLGRVGIIYVETSPVVWYYRVKIGYYRNTLPFAQEYRRSSARLENFSYFFRLIECQALTSSAARGLRD